MNNMFVGCDAGVRAEGKHLQGHLELWWVNTCYWLRYLERKFVDPVSGRIRMAANAALLAITQNGLNKERCVSPGKITWQCNSDIKIFLRPNYIVHGFRLLRVTSCVCSGGGSTW